MPVIRGALVSLLVVPVVVACVPGGPPTGGVPRASVASPAPTAPGSGAPSLPWPTRSLVLIPAGRHAISPPFELAFSLDVPAGWWSMHLHPEFTDLGWFSGSTGSGVPDRIIAFGHPTTVRGQVDAVADGLSARDAAALFRSRSDLQASEPKPFDIDGRAGLWLDLEASAFDTRVFSGDDGNGLGIGPDKVVRLGIVPLADGELLLVTVHAEATDLEATWAEARPILESIDLGRE